jgi:predicted nucleotidyltransferase component of viral defense system
MADPIDPRELFHFLFLQQLLATSDPRLYALKGGVNLRFFFNSPRFSEDMDLDVFGGSVETLRKNGYKILEDKGMRRALQGFGITDVLINDPARAKQTATTQRFRVRLVTAAGIELPTKVEFSRREAPSDDVATETISPEIAQRFRRLAFPCPHYRGRGAFLQKIRALPGRDQPQCRDVFDLHVLLLAGEGSRDLARQVDAATREAAIAVVEKLDYEDFKGQVVEFLIPETRAGLGTEGVWDAMRLEVIDLLA